MSLAALVAAVVLIAAGLIAVVVIRRSQQASASGTCIYPRESISTLHHLDALTGHDYSCVMTFANATSTWQQWEQPWYATTKSRDSQWAAWVRAQAGRRLVITLSLVPQDVPVDWRQLGARGAYDGYARDLGHNLVTDGLGDSIVRLAPEANGQSSPTASVGSTGADQASWARTWANEARAMRVPGSHFVFDWTVNAAYRALPLAGYYPGDSVVDVIGIDQYDTLVSGRRITGAARYAALRSQPAGLDQLLAFARSRRKPVSVPEWGLTGPAVPSGIGEDSTYMTGMATFFRTARVAYESYFDESVGGTVELEQAPAALIDYRRDVLGERVPS